MIVVDASVAVKWFVPERGSREAEALAASDVPRAAPDHVGVEVAQALLRHRRIGAITTGHVQTCLEELRALVRTVPTPWLLADAVDISAACGCSVYDALYVAAAERWDCHLVTADAKLRVQLAGSVWARRVLLLAIGPMLTSSQSDP